MAQKEYGCNVCKSIFTNPESGVSDDKGDTRCPYCQSSEVQNLDKPSDKYEFFRSMSRIRFG